MKTTLSCLLLGFSLLAAGCYDNGTKTDCVGLSCPSGLFWPDGGEVRIQYIKLPDGTDWRIITAFFIGQQDPDALAPPALGRCAPEGYFDANSRTYIEAGDSLTVNMGDREIVAPRVTGEDAVDFIGRVHDFAYINETYEKAGDSFFNAKHYATTEAQVDFSDRLEGIYVPPQLTVLSPAAAGVVPIKRNQDLLIEWEEIEPPAPDVTTAAAILFINAGYQPGPPLTCVGPNTGSFLVPKETINSLPPEGGILQVGTASNQAILSPDERRIDMWGTNCTALLYSIVE